MEYGPERKGDYLPGKTRDGREMRPGNLSSIMPGPEDTYQSYGYGWANASNTPYRWFKQYNHEGGIRTPMIAHWPAGIQARGEVVPTVAHLIDIMPTVLDVTGTSIPREVIDKRQENRSPMKMDGISLAPIFDGGQIRGHESLFFAHARGQALRQGDWKLVAIKQKKKPVKWELYNLKQDPLELNNLADQMPDKLDELAAIWSAESARLHRRANVD